MRHRDQMAAIVSSLVEPVRHPVHHLANGFAAMRSGRRIGDPGRQRGGLPRWMSARSLPRQRPWSQSRSAEAMAGDRPRRAAVSTARLSGLDQAASARGGRAGVATPSASGGSSGKHGGPPAPASQISISRIGGRRTSPRYRPLTGTIWQALIPAATRYEEAGASPARSRHCDRDTPLLAARVRPSSVATGTERDA